MTNTLRYGMGPLIRSGLRKAMYAPSEKAPSKVSRRGPRGSKAWELSAKKTAQYERDAKIVALSKRLTTKQVALETGLSYATVSQILARWKKA